MKHFLSKCFKKQYHNIQGIQHNKNLSRSQLDKEGAAVAVGFAAEVHCDEVLNKLGKIITIFDSPGVGASPHWVFCCELARFALC